MPPAGGEPTRVRVCALAEGDKITTVLRCEESGFGLDHVRAEFSLLIGERTAEEIKVAIGSAFPTDDEVKAEVRGRDLMTGLPKTVVLSPEEVRDGGERNPC